MSIRQVFFELNKNICTVYPALSPLSLLDYPAEDVFDLINDTIEYNERKEKRHGTRQANGIIRKPAGDNWF